MSLKIEINSFGYSLKELKRFQQIVGVFVKYGFGGVLSKISELGVHEKQRVQNLPEGVRLRMALTELGPAFVKLGQVLSTRTDILPKEVVVELEKLQDDVEPFDFTKAKKMFEDETGIKIKDAFKQFNQNPAASASMAQVHKAVLKNGLKVAVKIQRPDAEESFKTDTQILKTIAKLIEQNFSEARIYNPVLMAEEFERSVERELDFRTEARNAERFKNNFKDLKDVIIPKIHSKFTTKKTLVMDYIEGNKIKDLKATPRKKREITRKITFFVMKQIFIDGFFNADPHQGNFIIHENKIALIDFGMVSFLDENLKENLISLYSDVVNKNIDAFTEDFTKIARISENSNVEDFKAEVNDFIEELYGVTPNQIEIGKIFFELTSMARKYNISINPKFLVLAKVFVSLEGLQKQLDPDFNMIQNAKELVREIEKKEKTPSRMIGRTMKNLLSLQNFITTLPPKISQIVDKARTGTFKMEFEHVGLEKPVYRIDRAVNKISISMIIAALLVSSSLIILSKTGPLFQGFSIIGFAGLIFALMLSFWLATAILLEGEF
ncbi:MAG: AarF/ABC1/UbiB kinase family protein [Candidatus Marsarchaeota archaeon]|nr:AarF/ABC1/UbiB kinase family protein [Candidatus Marsarchaeota archaeon]